MKEAILLTDGYKLDHRRQYPENTEYVYSNWTPRSCHYYPEATEGAVVFGIQYFIKEYLMKQFQQDFFNEVLWGIFGGTINEKGYKVLNPKVGIIYGDSITLERQKEIYKRLEERGFAATNLVLGVGSYTYQYKSRDSLGFAMKATWCQVNGEGREIFKDPKTDDGTKKSLKGLICVQSDGDRYIAEDQVTKEQEDKSCLQTVFEDGKLVKEWSLRQIRDNVNNSIVLED